MVIRNAELGEREVGMEGRLHEDMTLKGEADNYTSN